MNADNLIIALQLAVDQFGKTILSDSKLINILLDLGAFKAMPSTKSVIRELITEGFVSKIVSSTDYSRVTSLVPVMVTQTGFNKDIVEYVVNCISFVIGLSSLWYSPILANVAFAPSLNASSINK